MRLTLVPFGRALVVLPCVLKIARWPVSNVCCIGLRAGQRLPPGFDAADGETRWQDQKVFTLPAVSAIARADWVEGLGDIARANPLFGAPTVVQPPCRSTLRSSRHRISRRWFRI